MSIFKEIAFKSRRDAGRWRMSKREWLWVLLCLLFFFLSNYPFLEIFNSGRLVAGMPSLGFYLFGIWIGAIVMLFLFAGSSPRAH
jgi:hypothetical protein